MCFSIRADDGDSITNLEDLGIAQNGAIPAIPFIRREGDQTSDAVFALDVFIGDHFENAGHLFSFGGIDRKDVGMFLLNRER